MKKLLLFVLLLSLFSCNDTEYEKIFDESITERTNKKCSEIKEFLCNSEHGWKTTSYLNANPYNTKKEFQIYKFYKDNTLEIYTPNTKKVTRSEYTITPTEGVLLTLTTLNSDIEDSVTPSPIAPQGEGQEVEFTFMDKTNDKIAFLGRYFQKAHIFEKAQESDALNFEKIKVNQARLNKVKKYENISIYVTKGLKGVSEKNCGLFVICPDIMYGKVNEIWHYPHYGPGAGIDSLTRIVNDLYATPEGISLSHPYEIEEGKILENFVYNEKLGTFEIDDEGLEGIILGTPFFTLTSGRLIDYNLFEKEDNDFCFIKMGPNETEESASCDEFSKIIDEIHNSGSDRGWNFYRIGWAVKSENKRVDKDDPNRFRPLGLIFTTTYDDFEYRYSQVFVPLTVEKLEYNRIKIKLGEPQENYDGGIAHLNSIEAYKDFKRELEYEKGFYVDYLYAVGSGITIKLFKADDFDYKITMTWYEPFW